MNPQKMTPELRFPEFTDDWQKKKLGDVADFSKGLGISKDDIIEGGITPAIRYGELYTTYGELINEVKSRTNLSPKDLVFSQANDVIIPASGETNIDIATASCVVKGGVALGGDLNIIRSQNSGVFLAYYLNNKKNTNIASLAQGVSVVHLYGSNLENLRINLPQKPEQQKIADFLTTIDSRIELNKQKLNNLKKYKKAIMQQIFSQQIRFKDENDNPYPDWQEKRLGDIGKIITGKTPSTTDKSLWDGNIKFVTPTDINGAKYQIESARSVTTAGSNLLPDKSIMYTCIASIGKMSLSSGKTITNQQINSLIPNGSVDNEYIYYALLELTPRIIATQSNNTLPIINKTEFSKFKIQLPSIEEQQKIATFLTALDARITAETTRLTSAKEWKKGLLQRMFV